MLIDHIFIVSRDMGKEANSLLEAGFLEGSNRVHPGQGTRNRKFYFENFFLEILWENNSEELESVAIQKIGLTDRVRFLKSAFSRFGLGLENTLESDSVFKDCEFYQPFYFPEGMCFEILTQKENASLPWAFRGPGKGPKTPYAEPLDHPNGIRKLTKATFQIPESDFKSQFVIHLRDHTQLQWESAEKVGIKLEFDGGVQKEVLDFPELDLGISF